MKRSSRYFLAKADVAGSPLSVIRGPRPTNGQLVTVLTHWGISVTRVALVRRSTFHHVFAASEGNKRYIIRTRAQRATKAQEFLTDRFLYGRLKKWGLPTLYVYTSDVSRHLVPFDFELLESARGVWMYDWVRTADDQSVARVLENLGTLIAKLHRIKTSRFGLLEPATLCGTRPSWEVFIRTRLQTHIDFLTTRQIVGKKLAQEVYRACSHIPHFSGVPVLLHGDLAHQNLFTDGEGVTALIDWEDALSGDPFYDVAYYATGCFNHPEWFTAFMKGYTRKVTLPVDYTKRFWSYYVRISVAKAVSRIRWGTKEARGLPDIRRRIMYGLHQLQGA